MPRKKQPPVTTVELKSGKTVEIGGLVRYYLNGWRAGFLREINGQIVKIQPITRDHNARLVTVGVDDLQEAL